MGVGTRGCQGHEIIPPSVAVSAATSLEGKLGLWEGEEAPVALLSMSNRTQSFQRGEMEISRHCIFMLTSAGLPLLG